MKSIGVGDSIDKIMRGSGIKRFVKFITNGKDCGCEDRKELFNAYIPYNIKIENCLTDTQIKDYKNFVDNRTMKLTGNGKAQGRLTREEIDFVTGFFAVVFNREKWGATCTNCAGTAKTLVSYVYKLDTVFVNSVEEKKKRKPRAKNKTIPAVEEVD